jgi:WhiB family redox-sensing transcriptional regulator
VTAAALRACTVDDCPNPLHARGMCSAHLGRWRRNHDLGPPIGDPPRPRLRTLAPDWTGAACLGVEPETFFPIAPRRAALAEHEAEAKAICQPCPLRDTCLAWALDTGQDHGVWGGLTEHERAALRKAGRR